MKPRPDQLITRVILPALNPEQLGKPPDLNNGLTLLTRLREIQRWKASTAFVNVPAADPAWFVANNSILDRDSNVAYTTNFNLMEMRLQLERIVGALESMERLLARNLDK